MNKYFALSILFFLFIQCSTNVTDDDSMKIKIDPTIATSIRFSDVFKDYEIIPLYKDTDNILVKPDKIEIRDSLIFFSSSDILYAYNKKGICKQKISKKGVGPGEYLAIADFRLDSDFIEINDRDNRKVLRYSYDGNYLDDFNHRLFSYTFVKYAGKYYFHSGCLYNKEIDNNYRVNVFDNKRIKHSFFLIDENERKINIIEYSNFALFEDTLSFSYCLSNNIYALSDKVSTRLKIDFGRYQLPNDFIKKCKNVQDFMTDVKKVKYATLIDGYKESAKFLFFSYAFNGERHFVLYDKSCNSLYVFNEFVDDLLFKDIPSKTNYSNLPLLITDDSFYRLIDAYEFIEKMNQTKNELSEKEWNDYINRNPSVYKIYSEISPEDNPIIIKYKFK